MAGFFANPAIFGGYGFSLVAYFPCAAGSVDHSDSDQTRLPLRRACIQKRLLHALFGVVRIHIGVQTLA